MNDYDIRSIFEEMELELIASMRRNLSRHQKWENDEGINWTMWQAEQLKTLENFKKENKKIFTKKFSSVNAEIANFLTDTYKVSGFDQERAILNELAKGNIVNQKYQKGLEGGFFSLNEDKMHALIKAITHDMTKAEHAMLRMVNDQYRKTIFKAQVMSNSGAFTLQQSIDAATRDFLKAGINCIQYKDGRRVNIASYAEMYIRTSTKRAKLISEGDVRKSYGIHTVRISRYGQCSETCLPWQGKVYVDDVWSGGTKEEAEEKNLTLLSEAIAGGLFHPNCKHTMTTYFYNFKKSLGKLQDDGVENPPEEQEHRKNQLHIQQQKRLETGSLDSQNIEQAKVKKEQWIEKDKQLGVIEKTKFKTLDDGVLEYKGFKINEYEISSWYSKDLTNSDVKQSLINKAGEIASQFDVNFSEMINDTIEYVQSKNTYKLPTKKKTKKVSKKKNSKDKIKKEKKFKELKDSIKTDIKEEAIIDDINSPEQLKKFFRKSENDMIISLTEDQSDIINDYTNVGYSTINNALRRDFSPNVIHPDIVKDLKNDIKRIDDVISIFENTQSFTTYRAVDGRFYSNLKIGDIHSDKAFMSTSPLFDVVEKFGKENGMDTILKIKVPKGKGYGAYINEISEFKDEEYEYLLKRNAKLKVTGFSNKNGYNVIEGVIVDE